MTKFQQSALTMTIMIVAFFCLLGWIGDYDYCEQVILHMSQEQYDSVKNHLTERNGSEPSDREIAHWWEDHHNKHISP